jgi:hypothetical protein
MVTTASCPKDLPRGAGKDIFADGFKHTYIAASISYHSITWVTNNPPV